MMMMMVVVMSLSTNHGHSHQQEGLTALLLLHHHPLQKQLIGLGPFSLHKPFSGAPKLPKLLMEMLQLVGIQLVSRHHGNR